MKKTIEEMFKKAKYDYYYPDCNILKKAIKMERNYLLNCSDYPKDYSIEGSNRRFERFLEIARRECKKKDHF